MIRPTPATFILASASPARRQLLEKAGISPLICPSQFDESQIKTKNPSQLVETLAQCKAQVIVDQIHQNQPLFPINSEAQKRIKSEKVLVLGCDSVLVVAGEIYGKPKDAAEAISRWQIMRGQVGQLLTGYALIDIKSNRKQVTSRVTQVYFASVSDDEIKAYIATGEPLNCAGCFAIEGKGGLFIEKLEGCHTNVIGLSLPLLRQMLNQLEYKVTDFWNLNTDLLFYTHQGDPQLD
ncbi:MAG: nucleoside triphosphate pyrophosphatase [Microcoleaceae cyanobacterium]